MVIKVGPVDRGVAASAKTGPLRQAAGMVLFADRRKIRLRVAAQAQVVVPDHQHLLVDRAVYLVAGGAALLQRLMLPHKGTPLLFVTLEAGLVDVGQGGR